MNVETRRARPEELARVNELRRMVNDLHCANRPDHFRPGFPQGMQDHLYERYGDDGADVVVAALEGRVVGYAMIDYINRPGTAYSLPRSYCHVEEFGVDSAARRQGVASALIAHIRHEALRRGYRRIELDMWEFNSGARAFYEAAGFQTTRRFMELNFAGDGE